MTTIQPSGWMRARNMLAFPHGWQRPAKTEEWAYQQCLAGLPDNRHVQLVSFPWATLIDLQRKGEAAKAKFYLEALRYCPPKTTLIRATVMQHIYAQDMLPILSSLGITDVFWSHVTRSETQFGSIRIHPFPLYPVCCADGAAADWLPLDRRRYLYSFIGAYQRGLYLTEVRQWIFGLPQRSDAYIERRKQWHFETAVYQEQISGITRSDEALQIERRHAEEYKAVLEQSVFSLCPSGSGPNTIRLWESLGMGAIPVVMADTHRLPGDLTLWEDAVVFVKEDRDAVNALPYLLERIKNTPGELEKRQRLLRVLWDRYGLSPERFIEESVGKALDDLLEAARRRQAASAGQGS